MTATSTPPAIGFQQPVLADTLRQIAASPGDFYQGTIANTIATEMQKNGGLITTADLAAYEVKDRQPITGNYHGYKIISAPPPSSGGIILVEILNILSTYKLPDSGPGGAASPDRSTPQVHLITEAFRRAYMDRADYLGDPDFTPLPLRQMASTKYAAAWRASIDPTHPTPSKDLVRPAGFLPPPPTLAPIVHESPQTHSLLCRRQGRQRRRQHLHPEQHLRLRRHPRPAWLSS